MIPGETFCGEGDIEFNPGAERLAMDVVNTGAYGFRLDIPAGTAVRFEAVIAQHVSLVPLRGLREVHGLSLNATGPVHGCSPTDTEA